MKISQKYTDFHSEFDLAMDYLNTTGTAARLNVSGSRMSSLGDKRTTLDDCWDVYSNPLTHTPPSELAMKNAYDEAHTEFSGVQQMLKNNIDITLTADDIAALHIHIDEAKRHEVPVVDFAPSNTVIKQSHCVTKIFASNPTEGFQKEKHKPKNVAKVGRMIAKVPAGSPAPGMKDYKEMENIGSTIFNIITTPEEVGMDAYIITYYLSPTGKSSVPSQPLKFIII